MALPLSKLPFELLRELGRWRWMALLLAVLVAFSVLLVGFIYPYEYRSDVVVYVDDSNIIRPLMEGSAEVTGISDQASSARELLWSRRILEKIAGDERIYGDAHSNLSVEQQERLYARLRNGIDVRPQGQSYFSIRFQGQDPRESYLVAQRLGQLFLAETNRRKRAESRNAFEFIDKQVKSYERQIKQTEEKIQEFKSVNTEGTEADVNQRLSQLRRQKEDTELELRELSAQRNSLQRQLAQVPAMTSAGGTSQDVLGERIAALEKRLDELRMTYHDTYPDVVSLESQLEELRKRHAEQQLFEDDGAQTGIKQPNPLHQELQAEISKTRTRERSLQVRLQAINQRIAEAEERMPRIQENKSEYTELTRDLEVNREIYNDLMRRREKARVSMHLDVEGQGMSFQIHEQAQFPLEPEGLQFHNFASVGWFLGLLAPLGLIIGLLQVDPRVRSEHQIREVLDIPLLGTLPRVKTPYERRRARRGYVVFAFIIILAGAAYGAVVFLESTGVLA